MQTAVVVTACCTPAAGAWGRPLWADMACTGCVCCLSSVSGLRWANAKLQVGMAVPICSGPSWPAGPQDKPAGKGAPSEKLPSPCLSLTRSQPNACGLLRPKRDAEFVSCSRLPLEPAEWCVPLGLLEGRQHANLTHTTCWLARAWGLCQRWPLQAPAHLHQGAASAQSLPPLPGRVVPPRPCARAAG